MEIINYLQTEDGIYQIEDLQAKLDIANINEIISMENNINMICISDSYGMTSVTTKWWQDYLKDLLKPNTFYNNAKGGACFSGHDGLLTFTTLIQEITPSITNKNDINLIIVVGGYNDKGTSDTLIQQGMKTFMNYCKTNFPNAKVLVGEYGNSMVKSYKENLEQPRKNYPLINMYNGYYLSNSENVLHRYSYFGDEVHPNNAGSQAIALSIYNALLGKGIDVTGNIVTPIAPRGDSSRLSGNLNMYQEQFNNILSVFMEGPVMIKKNSGTWTITKNTEFIFGTISDGFASGTSRPCTFYAKIGLTNTSTNSTVETSALCWFDNKNLMMTYADDGICDVIRINNLSGVLPINLA
jgi:hypothetical protein